MGKEPSLLARPPFVTYAKFELGRSKVARGKPNGGVVFGNGWPSGPALKLFYTIHPISRCGSAEPLLAKVALENTKQ